MAVTKIDAFDVMYSSNTFVPRIGLKSAGNSIGQLLFKPDGSILPQDGESGGQVSLYYHLEDFENVINLLRSEKTMHLIYSGSGGGFENGIQTTPQALGA